MRHLRSVPPPDRHRGSYRRDARRSVLRPQRDRSLPGELRRSLERTSRTFALTIPLLDEPLATDVGLSYLLFRIADTLEDAPSWGRDARMATLDSFGEWLVGEEEERAWLEPGRVVAPHDRRGLPRAPRARRGRARRRSRRAVTTSRWR